MYYSFQFFFFGFGFVCIFLALFGFQFGFIFDLALLVPRRTKKKLISRVEKGRSDFHYQEKDKYSMGKKSVSETCEGVL